MYNIHVDIIICMYCFDSDLENSLVDKISKSYSGFDFCMEKHYDGSEFCHQFKAEYHEFCEKRK